MATAGWISGSSFFIHSFSIDLFPLMAVSIITSHRDLTDYQSAACGIGICMKFNVIFRYSKIHSINQSCVNDSYTIRYALFTRLFLRKILKINFIITFAGG